MPAALKYKFKRSETLSTNLLPMISLSKGILQSVYRHP
jgi:hypothetical protein